MWPGWCNLIKKNLVSPGLGNFFIFFLGIFYRNTVHTTLLYLHPLSLLEEWVTVAPNVVACMLGAYDAGLLSRLRSSVLAFKEGSENS